MLRLNVSDEMGPRGIDVDILYPKGYDEQTSTYPDPCCVVRFYEADSGRFLSQGHAYLALGDNFNRAVGRRIAFERAVDNFTDDRGVRQQLWKAYMNHRAAEGANPPRMR